MLEKIDYKRVWQLSWPIMLANVTIPLIGATNVIILGHLSSPIYLGAAALGVTVLQCIYWTFAFLRKSTTGLTAQAVGAGNNKEVCIIFFRSIALALVLGIAVTLIKDVVSYFGFLILEGSQEVEELAKTYFDIRILGAFANFGNYVVLGWLYGIQKPKLALFLRILINAINIPMAIFLVLFMDMNIAGVASSALAGNTVIFIASLFILAPTIKSYLPEENKSIIAFIKKEIEEIFRRHELMKIFKLNTDVFIRTVLVFLAFSWFTASSAKQGDVLLAVNSVLINMFWFISYALDGFSNAAETLVGQAVGAKNQEMLTTAISKTTKFAGLVAIGISFFYFTFGHIAIDLYTTIEEVRVLANEYLIWLIVLPIVSVWCFQMDGIFIGATDSVNLRNMMIISFVLYSFAIIYLPKYFANHGLWMALGVFMILRAITLAFKLPALIANRIK